MKRIILGMLFVLMFCGNVYSQDWSGTYKTIDYDEDPRGGESTITIKKSGNGYKVDITFEEQHVRYPSTCYLKSVNGNNNLDDKMLRILNSKNQELITLLQTSKYIRMNFNKNIRGIFGECVDDYGKKFKPDKEFEKSFRDDIFEGMMFKKVE